MRNDIEVYIYAIWNTAKKRSWLFSIWLQLSPEVIDVVNTRDGSRECVITPELDFTSGIDSIDKYNTYYQYNLNVDEQQFHIQLTTRFQSDPDSSKFCDADVLYIKLL